MALISISLAYAPDNGQQHYLEMQVADGTTIVQALALSGWLTKFVELENWCETTDINQQPIAKQWHVGVYSEKKPLNYVLQDQDRLEVYRSLTADPMNKRKNRANNK